MADNSPNAFLVNPHIPHSPCLIRFHNRKGKCRRIKLQFSFPNHQVWAKMVLDGKAFGWKLLVGRKKVIRQVHGLYDGQPAGCIIGPQGDNWCSENLLLWREAKTEKRTTRKSIKRITTRNTKKVVTRYFLSICTKGLSSARWLQAQPQQADIWSHKKKTPLWCIFTRISISNRFVVVFFWSKEVGESLGETHRLHWAPLPQQQLDLPMCTHTRLRSGTAPKMRHARKT